MRVLFTILILTVQLGLLAQTTFDVSQGEDYTKDIYVTLENGEVSNPIATDWDIAFEIISPFAAGIRVNDGHGTQAAVYTASDISGWDDVDSTGFATWPKLHNGLELWSDGALNQNLNGDPFDFGWGIYTGDPDHDVIGDSIYIVQSADLTTKKLKIDILDSGDWTFTYADLDGTNEQVVDFNIFEYPERNFVYYSLANGEFINREPANTSWDLMFTRYFGSTAFGPGVTTGVLANNGVELIKADGVVIEDVMYQDYTWVTEDISVIGNDWKFLNSDFAWEVTPERAYFVKTLGGDIYKMWFTNFSGSSTGDLTYVTELISGVSVDELENPLNVSIFPNPSNGDLSVLLNEAATTSTQIKVQTITGKEVLNEMIPAGRNAVQLDLENEENGIYLLRIIQGNTMQTHKVIVK